MIALAIMLLCPVVAYWYAELAPPEVDVWTH